MEEYGSLFARLEQLELKFQQGLCNEALADALSYLGEDDGSIWNWLQGQYIEPFQKSHQRMKEANLEQLKEYSYFYGETCLDDVQIIWYDQKGFLIYKSNNQIIVKTDQFCLHPQGLSVVVNSLNIEELLDYIRRCKYVGSAPNYMEPVYLYYDQDVFDAFVQCVDFREMIAGGYVVILIGEEQCRAFFEDAQAIMPQRVLGSECQKIDRIVHQIINQKIQNMERYKKNIDQYYGDFGSEIIQRVQAGKPKILFVTSYFTTVLQYHTRDCRNAAEKMGLETELLIERGPIFRTTKEYCTEALDRFRPDIVFCIDHFRFENDLWPKEIVWIAWVQDFLTKIMDPSTPAKLGERDFVMTHFTTWKKFREIGYCSDRLIEAAIPASSDVYKIYDLTAEEKKQYTCGVCLVCHASDVDAHIEQFVKQNQMDQELADVICEIYKGYQSYVYESGEVFYNVNLFKEFISGCLLQVYNAKMESNMIDGIAKDMYENFNQRVYRQALVDWILDAGITDIKLWGNGWSDHEKYKSYAMGSAENGETLSKIYQAAKIVIGNNVMTTAAARAWETMLSGGFYLSNYIPPEEDITDIRKIVEVGQDVIMFYGKDDLIKKIHYYLEYEEERQIMIERGRKAALENMTYDILMERMLQKVKAQISWGGGRE